MSSKYVFYAMEAETGNPLRKSVLIGLADNTDNDGMCFPSYQHIADKMEMSRRTVMIHVEALEKMGFISKEPRNLSSGKNRSNVYRLMLNGTKNPINKVIHSGESPAPVTSESPALGSESPAPLSGESPAPITCHSFNQSLKTHARKENNNFIKPSVNEIADYCKQIGSKVDAITFHEFYEKKHWIVGRGVMTDWQEAVRYWDNGKKTKELTNLPSNDNELESWASKVGLGKANAGESFPQYRARLYRDFERAKMNERGVSHG